MHRFAALPRWDENWVPFGAAGVFPTVGGRGFAGIGR
jgi:hypothetical protein